MTLAAVANKFARLLPKSNVGRGIVTLASGTFLAQAVTACSMPIVTRLYAPAEIGVISMFIAFFGFWSALLSWRYESAMLVASDDAESHIVFRVGVACVVLMSLLSAPLLFFLTSNGILGFGLLPWWAAIFAAPIFLGFGLFMMYRAWGLRGGFVRNISQAVLARSGANAVVRVLFGLLGGGVAGLFAAELAGAWGATGTLRGLIGEQYADSRPAIDWIRFKATAKRYAKFAQFEMPSVALDQLTLTLPVPMIAALYGAQAAGWFGLARILVAIPNAQIGRAVADVFQMELARKLRMGERAQARKLFYKLLSKLAVFGLLPLASIVIAGPLFVPWIFGKPWAEMGLITACIAPWLYAALIVSSLSRLLSVLERQEYKLIYDMIALLLIGAVYLLAWHRTLGLIETVLLLSAANIIGYGIYMLVLLRIVEKDLRVST